jgi:hypothetical protein
MRELLIAAGFRVHRSRADCIHCSGHGRLTVAFTEEFAFCHRCKWTANRRALARSIGHVLPPAKIAKVQIPKHKFRNWISQTYGAMANQERESARRANLAISILAHWPNIEVAWDALAAWYHNQRNFERFFESAQDKCGRYWLYRGWRAANR